VPDAALTPLIAPSERVRLARLALGAASAVPGVAGATAGRPGVVVTADPTAGRVLQGVTVAAGADGLYQVVLRLVALPVPLHALADEVRRRVVRAAAADGLAARLGDVDVEIADVVSEVQADPVPVAPAPVAPPPVAPSPEVTP
jgi:hypothetical protein